MLILKGTSPTYDQVLGCLITSAWLSGQWMADTYATSKVSGTKAFASQTARTHHQTDPFRRFFFFFPSPIVRVFGSQPELPPR